MPFDAFIQMSLILGVTTVMAWVAKILRQPLLIAYIAAGIISGPVFLHIFSGDRELYDVFAQFGVVFLLFVVGLGLNFTYLRSISKVAFFTGFFQVLFTGGLGWILLTVLGWHGLPALYVAVASVFSSTIIITKLLADKKQTDSVYGRYTIGLMLVQDVLAILIMIILNFLETGSGQQGTLVGAIILLVGKGIGIIGFIVVCARYILPFILHRIAHSAEFLFLFTLAWCFGVTSVAKFLGFSMETGALMAGLALGSSPFQAEIMSRIKPLRDFFLILFFVVLGSGVEIANALPVIGPAIIFAIFILVGSPLILYWLFRRMKFTRRNSFMVGLTAAQVSEFGFVLLFAGERLGLTDRQDTAFFTLVALITIFASSYLITYNEHIFVFFKPWFQLFKKDRHVQAEAEKPLYDIWLVGAHRIGWRICQALVYKKVPFAIIDFNPETLAVAQKEGVPVYFGDAADVEFLSELPLDKAKLIISTIPDPHDQLTLIKHVRSLTKKTYIVATLTHAKFRDHLYAAGADYVMLPHVLGGELVADLIKRRTLTKQIFKDLRKEQEAEIGIGFVA